LLVRVIRTGVKVYNYIYVIHVMNVHHVD
jgi:hypothetical protein